MKDKSVTFCFLKLKAKEKAIFSKIIWGRRLFCGKFRSLISKLMFTHSALLTQSYFKVAGLNDWNFINK